MVGLDVKIFLLLQEYERRTHQAHGDALADDDSDDNGELEPFLTFGRYLI